MREETVSSEADLLGAFEDHSPDGIRKMFAAGVSPIEPIKGMRPIDSLVAMYLRSPRFAECLQVMLDAGATIGDPLLQAILLDDDIGLRRLLARSGEGLKRKLSFSSAFTSCRGVSALHICAEFNSVRCGRILLENGADVNAQADQDGDGIGGHTPIFHAVNSIFNYCRPMMEILVDAAADRTSGESAPVGGVDELGDSRVRRYPNLLRSVWSLSSVSSARGAHLQ